MSEILNVKIEPINPKAPGFLPLYRKVLASKRVFQDFEHAQPEDLDAARALLKQHISIPASDAEKDALLDRLVAEDVMELFGKIAGANTVPPASGAA